MNMKRPDTYFGPAEFFGTLDDPEAETESVCFVGEEEIVALTDLENASELDAEDAFPQLATAIDDFILTKLIRELRNEAGFDTGHHHTMLIHVSRLNVDQLMLTEKVEGLVEERENDLSWQISELHERLKARWDAEFAQSLDLRILGAKFKRSWTTRKENGRGAFPSKPSILSMLNNAWPLEMSQLGPSPSAATS